jgi:hypothetical protein
MKSSEVEELVDSDHPEDIEAALDSDNDLEIRLDERTQIVGWKTDSDFFDVAEQIQKWFPVKYKLVGMKNDGDYHLNKSVEKFMLRNVLDPVTGERDYDRVTTYEHIQMNFDDFSIWWGRNSGEENYFVQMYLDGSGIEPFNQVYCGPEDETEYARRVDQLLNRFTYNIHSE